MWIAMIPKTRGDSVRKANGHIGTPRVARCSRTVKDVGGASVDAATMKITGGSASPDDTRTNTGVSTHADDAHTDIRALDGHTEHARQ
jgi:hypothetical protein